MMSMIRLSQNRFYKKMLSILFFGDAVYMDIPKKPKNKITTPLEVKVRICDDLMINPLKISNLHKSFGAKKVLDGINIEVQKNEIFGFIGLNGVGKTTSIKIILDLLKQDEGSVELFGKNAILPKSRKDLAYLPEKFHPSAQLRGVEFLKFVTGLHKQTFDLKEAKRIAKILDLEEEVLNLKIGNYSKGMTQKLGLLGTFLSKANLIILDEPMSGLDPIARMNLKELLIKYKEQGHSIFFSSHILSDIDEICDRIAILSNTKLIFVGKPQEFKKLQNEQNLEKAFVKAITTSYTIYQN